MDHLLNSEQQHVFATEYTSAKRKSILNYSCYALEFPQWHLVGFCSSSLWVISKEGEDIQGPGSTRNLFKSIHSGSSVG